MLISRNLKRSLEVLNSVGVVVVASAGNRQGNRELNYTDFSNTVLNAGNTIFVGSHNDQNLISSFSVGQCRVTVCSRGEGVHLESIQPNLQSGTSFAAPYITAAVANVLSHTDILPTEIKNNLRLSAAAVKCECIRHHGNKIERKFDPENFMRATHILNTEPGIMVRFNRFIDFVFEFFRSGGRYE